ncbi:hypothetical protein SEA_SLIMJIMMY_77 [Mycobacterium phage SlimJimmy]|uniref:Uncharacterized protein n=1 Tax=Mycobacterium phage Bricole TaxID=1718601 RepID=A0A0M3UKL2_9CAUD|nr:hypothetical protein SEA_BRICOLE_77 [Mycobacterium phage Bricole]WMI33256.1 hypothetical protein SEA_SLIMJIMMY_77 [Mycobacterium phage SlimJimmy]
MSKYYVRALDPTPKDFGPFTDFESAETVYVLTRQLGHEAEIYIDVGPGYSALYTGEVQTRRIPLRMEGAIHDDPVELQPTSGQVTVQGLELDLL